MLELNKVSKRYGTSKVLCKIDMTLNDIGMIGIVGPSGCGKSTLLHIIGGIDHEYSGTIKYNQSDIRHHRHTYRKKHISFLFQNIHLIHLLNIENNIKLPIFFNRTQYKEIQHEFNDQNISSLSLGQRQKISYLRGICCFKDILLCDEPTASLDEKNSYELMSLLKQQSNHQLVIIVSHNKALIDHFCDEVYEMNNGMIINHYKLSSDKQEYNEERVPKKILFPLLKLSLASLKYYKKRTIQLIAGLFISLFCILSSLTLSTTLEEQIYQYIYSLVPPSAISFRSSQPIDEKSLTMNQREDIIRTQLFLDDYEFLGLSFQYNHYEESKTLFIGDDSSPYDHVILKYGQLPQDDDEIVISYTTAKQLSDDIQSLINKKIYAHYKVGTQTVYITYTITGISNQSTSIHTIYQKPNAYIHLLQEKQKDLKSSYGIIYVHSDYQRSDVIKELEMNYKEYEFIETGLSTTNHIDETLTKVKTVLYFFTFLALLSSLFLIGEVMYLNVILESKNYAIMQCFGASPIQIIFMILLQALIIEAISFTSCLFIFYQCLNLLNIFLKDFLLTTQVYISIPIHATILAILSCTLLILFSLIFSIIHVAKMNIVDTLKK